MRTNHWLNKRCPVCLEAKLKKTIYYHEDGYNYDTIYNCNHCKMYRSQYYIYPRCEYFIDGKHLVWISSTIDAELEMSRQINDAIKKARNKFIDNNKI